MNHDNHDLLSKELDYISLEAREYVLDSIYCTLFNKGHQLDGNTEVSDLETRAIPPCDGGMLGSRLWFAREIYGQRHPNKHWDNLPEAERIEWIDIADACLKRLPFLMGRISSRCKVQAEAVRSLLKAERKKKKA